MELYGEMKIRLDVVESGIIEGRKYYICTAGTHPTAYVIKLPSDKLHKDDIVVHGGITFFDYLYHFDCDEIDKFRFFYGWDYAHGGGDYYHVERDGKDYSIKRHKYTIEEIRQDVTNVIRQLNDNGLPF